MRTAVALLMIGAALAAPAVSSATWTDPDDLSADGFSAYSPQVAVDASGRSVVVWFRGGVTQARGRGADGSLGPVQTLSLAGGPSQDPDVAVDPVGDGVIVWHRFGGFNDRVEARARAANGSLGPIQTLSASGQSAVAEHVAIDQTGDSLIVWRRSDGTNDRIQAVFRSSGGSLGPVLTLSSAGGDASVPQVAMNPAGDALFAWTRYDGSNYRVQVRARSASGVLGGIQTISPAGQATLAPQVAIDPSGNAVVVWRSFDGVNWRIYARARSSTGVLGPVQPLSASGEPAGNPQIAMDPTGKAYFLWNRWDESTNRVQIRVRDTAGNLSSTQALTPVGVDALATNIGVDQNGNALALWTRFDGLNYRVESRRRTAAGTLTPMRLVSVGGEDASAPDLAMNATGQAVATWQRTDTPYNRVQASAGP